MATSTKTIKKMRHSVQGNIKEIKNAPSALLSYIHTVKPVLNGHPWGMAN